MTTIRVAVIGAGSFGQNHIRIIDQMEGLTLAAIVDTDLEKARKTAWEHGSRPFGDVDEALGSFEAAIVATPTVTHDRIASRLLQAGVDVLVEKPIAESAAAGEGLARLARECGRLLQVGHLERFNPAVIALERALTIPLFFEVHRLSVFSPRSLDIDVVLDLMIHDLDIVLSFTKELPEDIRAAGISVLSPKVDIANVRLSFSSGCVANLTASRVSTERVRKLRLFQPGEYISVDYQRREAVKLAVKPVSHSPTPQIEFEPLAVQKEEPLRLELESFFDAVRNRTPVRIDGLQASNALRVAESILDKIKEHADLVAETLRRRG